MVTEVVREARCNPELGRQISFEAGIARREQPLDVGDLLNAIMASLDRESADSYFLNLGGAEALSHLDLIARAARLFGRDRAGKVIPIPVPLMRAFASLLSRLLKSSPITPAMLGVLEHEDRIDNGPALENLGIELTPLDETLKRYIGPEV